MAQQLIYLDKDIRRAIRIEAAQRGISISDLVLEALQSRTILIHRPEEHPAPKPTVPISSGMILETKGQ